MYIQGLRILLFLNTMGFSRPSPYPVPMVHPKLTHMSTWKSVEEHSVRANGLELHPETGGPVLARTRLCSSKPCAIMMWKTKLAVVSATRSNSGQTCTAGVHTSFQPNTISVTIAQFTAACQMYAEKTLKTGRRHA